MLLCKYDSLVKYLGAGWMTYFKKMNIRDWIMLVSIIIDSTTSVMSSCYKVSPFFSFVIFYLVLMCEELKSKLYISCYSWYFKIVVSVPLFYALSCVVDTTVW